MELLLRTRLILDETVLMACDSCEFVVVEVFLERHDWVD